jgi:hypothetical protein
VKNRLLHCGPLGGVAQRLERRTHNPQVGGSNPPAAILRLPET